MVLKPLDAALRDGDKVYATVRLALVFGCNSCASSVTYIGLVDPWYRHKLVWIPRAC